MGGKTQQRVAGNAKPSNSGRIRELLVNQQLGTGNIITFSALSAKNNQKKQQSESSSGTSDKTPSNSREAKGKDELQETDRNAGCKEKPSKQADLPTPKPTTPSKDNTRLVVRRVGNRDLYTRVKISDGQSLDINGLLPSAVQPSDAGVKKPPQDIQSITATQPSPYDDNDEKDDKVPVENDSSEATQEDPDEKLDFFGLLDRLEATRVLVAANMKPKTLREISEESLRHESDLLKLFQILIRKFLNDLSIEDWDLVSNTLDKWIHWISDTEYPLQETYHAAFCAQIFMFVHQLILQAEKIKAEPIPTSSYVLMQSLLDDWANFSSSTMFLDLITLYLKLVAAEASNQTQSNQTIRPMIEALAHIMITVDTRVVLSHHNLLDYLSPRVEFDQEFKKPKSSTFCGVVDKHFNSFAAICGLLRSNLREILITSHTIVSKTMTTICESIQSSMLMQEQEAVDDNLVFPPEPLMAILTSRDSMMSALLSDYHVGDISVTIEPNTDSYACTLSYLFAWDLTIQFIVGVDKELGQCIIHSMKKLGLIQRLLDNIFMLLPPLDDRDSLNFKIVSNEHGSAYGTQSSAGWEINNFLKSPLQTTVKRPVNEIELVALHVYFSVASHMPVTVRKWYNNNANKRLCNLVNEYTVKHISSVICSLEMESVQKKCQERANKEDSKNLVIKARPSAKEVYAIYTRDEFKMELTIKLPSNYPLGSVQIDGGKRVGVTDLKWRSWLLQLTTFLAHQNGPILDGIDLWRTNIDKRFEGVEKCTICFSILHSNYQLPKKKCHTCSNMFHNLCLYKWFESSGNSTCPLCRNPW